MAVPPSSILYLPLQALLFWDVHVLLALERWKRQGGKDARRWLTTLGEAEALGALAGLQFDQPTWTLPAIAPDGDAYQASRMGHPLLRDDVWPVLAETYGAAHAGLWWTRWRLFFLSCAELFAFDAGQQWWVSHYLFRPRHGR